MDYRRTGNPGICFTLEQAAGFHLAAPIALSPETPERSLQWVARQAGEAVMQITACAPGTDWASKDCTAACMEVSIDNVRQPFDVVLFMGAKPFTYTVCLGPVESGTHTVNMRFAGEKSAPGSFVVVHEMRLVVIGADDPQYCVLRHAPMLYGRDVNNHSDVPLLMWYQEHATADGGRKLSYTVMWSNEDGGTSTLGLITTWGHTTDIEWVYDLTLGPSGEIKEEFIQAPGHARLPFGGRRIGLHPLLQVATANNNVIDTGATRFLFGMYPTEQLPPGAAREEMMDRYPWSHRITAVELAREGKLRAPLTPDLADREKLLDQKRIADLRNYVFIDYTATVTDGRIGFAVKRRNDPLWYGWYPELRIAGIGRSGINRVAVEVPAGTSASSIEALRVHTQAAGQAKDYKVELSAIQKVMMLQEDYTPGPVIFTWSGRQLLSSENDTVLF